MRKLSLFFLFFSLVGCQKYFVTVAQSRVDVDYLASSHVATPDPRQANPPFGDRLIFEWQLPTDLLRQEPVLRVEVLYKNYTKALFEHPIAYCNDFFVYTLLDEEYREKRGILTYAAKVVTNTGEIYREWKHQLWTDFIVIEPESAKESPEEKEEEWEELAHPSSSAS